MDGLGEFLVTPRELQKEAEVWQSLFIEGKNIYGRIEKTSQNTQHCLKGKAGEVLRKELIKRSRQGMEKLEQLQIFSDKLTEMAEVYQKAEGENKNVFDRT